MSATWGIDVRQWLRRWAFLNRSATVYTLLIGGLSVFVVWRWPIIAGDTDLWYHLNGGRYLFEHQAIPRDSFFSFMTPPRHWVDYFWLFQALVYSLYTWGQYHALVFLRSSIFLALVLFIGLFLFARGRDHQPALPWLAFLFVCYCLLLVPRCMQVRPYLCTYLMIVMFLSILEFRPRWAWALPVLGLLWSNLHGIVYPILLLICAAYALEFLIRPSRVNGSSGSSVLVALLLSAGTVFFTPHGLGLLRMPFVSTSQASEYISEMRPFSVADLTSFQVSLLAPSSTLVISIFFIVVCLALITAVVKRAPRLSHLMLCVAGFALLTRGNRFIYEFALLALPLLKANPVVQATGLLKSIPKPIYLLTVAGLMLLPVRYLSGGFSDRPRYPFSHRHLPEGVVTFLNHMDVGGFVLNHPNPGGYLQWRLYPRYLIYMDMEVPLLFTDEDMALVGGIFSDADVLRKVLARYQPGFLMVPGGYKDFPTLIEQFPDYRLVFFDDTDVLYVNRQLHPTLVEQFELKALNPFELHEKGIDGILGQRQREGKPASKPESEIVFAVRETLRVREVFPDGDLTNQLLATAYLRDGTHDRALPYTEALITNFPESPVGYRLRGDAFKGLRLFSNAVAMYRVALAKSALSERSVISTQIGLSYFEEGQFAQAYKALKAGIGFFSANTPREELYALGVSALRIGKRQEAEVILTYLADYKLSTGDSEWAEKIHSELAHLRNQPKS